MDFIFQEADICMNDSFPFTIRIYKNPQSLYIEFLANELAFRINFIPLFHIYIYSSDRPESKSR